MEAVVTPRFVTLLMTLNRKGAEIQGARTPDLDLNLGRLEWRNMLPTRLRHCVISERCESGCVSFRELLRVLNLIYRKAKSLLSWTLSCGLRGSGESSCLAPRAR
jgi:hypothetical protein